MLIAPGRLKRARQPPPASAGDRRCAPAAYSGPEVRPRWCRQAIDPDGRDPAAEKSRGRNGGRCHKPVAQSQRQGAPSTIAADGPLRPRRRPPPPATRRVRPAVADTAPCITAHPKRPATRRQNAAARDARKRIQTGMNACASPRSPRRRSQTGRDRQSAGPDTGRGAPCAACELENGDDAAAAASRPSAMRTPPRRPGRRRPGSGTRPESLERERHVLLPGSAGKAVSQRRATRPPRVARAEAQRNTPARQRTIPHLGCGRASPGPGGRDAGHQSSARRRLRSHHQTMMSGWRQQDAPSLSPACVARRTPQPVDAAGESMNAFPPAVSRPAPLRAPVLPSTERTHCARRAPRLLRTAASSPPRTRVGQRPAASGTPSPSGHRLDLPGGSRAVEAHQPRVTKAQRPRLVSTSHPVDRAHCPRWATISRIDRQNAFRRNQPPRIPDIGSAAASRPVEVVSARHHPAALPDARRDFPSPRAIVDDPRAGSSACALRRPNQGRSTRRRAVRMAGARRRAGTGREMDAIARGIGSLRSWSATKSSDRCGARGRTWPGCPIVDSIYQFFGGTETPSPSGNGDAATRVIRITDRLLGSRVLSFSPCGSRGGGQGDCPGPVNARAPMNIVGSAPAFETPLKQVPSATAVDADLVSHELPPPGRLRESLT